MDILPQLFSSKAKIKILRALYSLSRPIALREIARLAGLPVYSVQYGLKQLLQEKILTKKNQKNRTLYSLNSTHLYFQTLAQLFNMDTQLRLQHRALSYAKKTKPLLDFITSAETIFKTIRRRNP